MNIKLRILSTQFILLFVLSGLPIFAACVNRGNQTDGSKFPSNKAGESRSGQSLSFDAENSLSTGQSEVGQALSTVSTDLNGDGIPDAQNLENEKTRLSKTGLNVPPGWPQDIPIMQGYTIIASVNRGDGSLMVGAVGKVSIKETLSFYSRIPGWVLESEISKNDSESYSFVLMQKSSRLEVIIEPVSEYTRLNLLYRKENK